MEKTKPIMMAALMAACGPSTSTGPGPKSAAGENAPAPPSEGQIKQAKAERAGAPAKVSASDSDDFEAAVTKWEAARKSGALAQECGSLKSTFRGLAGRERLAAAARFNVGALTEACGGSPKDAEDDYQAALKANPAYGPALSALGTIYYKQGNAQTARQWFERAIAADPTHVSAAYANLAAIQYNEARERGDRAAYKDIIGKLRRALAIDGENAAAYNTLALVYFATAENDRSKLQLAELVCKQGKETNDKYAPLYNTTGLIKLRRKDVSGALREFEEAVKLDPKFTEAHLNIGAIGLSSRQYDKAAIAFDAVLKLQPNNFDATVGMGVAARGQKKIDEAENWYKKAASLDGKNCSIPYNLGLLYQDYKTAEDNSNLRQAQDQYNKFLSCGRADEKKKADAQRRIKDIDDTFTAIEQQKKMEAEAKAIQEQMERQQQQQAPAAPAR